MFKPLLAYWHAVDLPQVVEPFNRIDCDKLILSYFPYPHPHLIIDSFFKIHPEYTHLILMPNDLIVHPEDFEKVCEMAKNYRVCSAVANVDLTRNVNYFNVCWKLPSLGYPDRHYAWIAKSTADMLIMNGHPIQKVKFAGFPLMCISREVMEKTRINWLDPQLKGVNKAIWETSGGYSNDLAFCYNLDRIGEDIYCDFRIRLYHLRNVGVKQTGIKNPKLYFIKDGVISKPCLKRVDSERQPRLVKAGKREPLEHV